MFSPSDQRVSNNSILKKHFMRHCYRIIISCVTYRFGACWLMYLVNGFKDYVRAMLIDGYQRLKRVENETFYPSGFITAVAVFRKPNAIPLCFSIDLVLNFLLSWLLVLLPSTFFLDVLFFFFPVVPIL